MNLIEAKKNIYTEIVNSAFIKNGIFTVDSNVQSKNPMWVMNFKTLSTDKRFLESFVAIFEERFKDVSELQVCGMESGALPFIAALSLLSPRCKNAFYIRKSAKKSDLAKTIEGVIQKDLPIIIIDDILNSGNTVKKQTVVLEEQGFIPHAVFSILRFRESTYYEVLFSKKVYMESIFELNDFTRELKVNNFMPSKVDTPSYHRWESVWKVKLSKNNPYYVFPKSAPVIDDENIYVGADDGSVAALLLKTGDIVWQQRLVTFGENGKRIFSSLALSKGNLFFGAYDGNFYCLDVKTGKRNWVCMDADWIGSSPAVREDGNVVYIGLEFGLFKKNGGVVAVDVQSGKTLWQYYEMSGLTHASPAVSTALGVVICGCNDNFVYCLDQKTGKLLWKYETGGEVKYGAIFDEKKKMVIIGSMDGCVYCLSTITGEVVMKFSAQAGFYSNAVLYNDTIIIGSLDKNIYCFDMKTKTELWRVATRGRIFASPVVHKQSIFIGSNDGSLYEIDAKTGKVISLIQLSERIVNKVIIKEEKGERFIYIPTHACELYKFREII